MEERTSEPVVLRVGRPNPLHTEVLPPLSPLNRTPTRVDRDAGLVSFDPFHDPLSFYEDGLVPSAPPKEKRLRVALYAGGPSRRHAPLIDDTWEVWGLNVVPTLDIYGRLRADRWFEMHPLHAQSADDLRWLKQCPFPVYMPHGFGSPDSKAQLFDAAPSAVVYPLDRVLDSLPIRADYFACTFAYQIALAISDGFKTIGLFGVDLAFGSIRERTLEAANVAWWCGFAEGQGVRIFICGDSPMLRHPGRYGYDYDAELADVKQYEDGFRNAVLNDAAAGVSDRVDA